MMERESRPFLSLHHGCRKLTYQSLVRAGEHLLPRFEVFAAVGIDLLADCDRVIAGIL